MRKRMFGGELFLDNCQGLNTERAEAKKRMILLNKLYPTETDTKKMLIGEILGVDTPIQIETPFHFTYGRNIEVGKDCYINYNCNFIDDGKIKIGNRVLIGPNVTIVTVEHPINPDFRKFMYTEEVIISDNCWIGASTVINSGVTIGENSVIGSGSVVTKNIPPNSVAVGNPCRVIRDINKDDLKFYRKDKKIDINELNQVKKINEII